MVKAVQEEEEDKVGGKNYRMKRKERRGMARQGT